MMDCKKAQTLLNELIDGRLNESEQKAIEEHLSGCRECRHERDMLVKTLASLRELELMDVPSDFIQNLWNRIDQFESVKRTLVVAAIAGFVRRHRKAILSGIAAFVVAFGGTFYYLQQKGPVEQIAEPSDVGQPAPEQVYIMNNLPAHSDSANTFYARGYKELDPIRRLPSYAFEEVKPVALTPDDF